MRHFYLFSFLLNRISVAMLASHKDKERAPKGTLAKSKQNTPFNKLKTCIFS